MSEIIIPFTQEANFEEALTKLLTRHGWGAAAVLEYPTEEDLISNWRNIIYHNNRDINQLGDFPLTDSEMAQIINKVDLCTSPYLRNQLLNGKYIDIKRDNPNDHVNYGKIVYLKLFEPREINTGQSVYQIARQPKFRTQHPLAGERRGDLMLLINGMPVIHIELKRSGVDVSQAVNQIKRYTAEGVFSQGIYSLVQIFVAMTPEKTLYFANPGNKANFNSAFQFHWADSNNNEIFDWQKVTANLLSIPMAHQMVGQYTIADDKDQTLKVLRSYQYYAVNAICDKVHNTNWDSHAHQGGFVWHTTGSGKTMTSFKAAQLLSKANEADKVVFLLDRIELSTQSADEYKGFSNADDQVLETDNTAGLISCLESDDKNVCLIVTSLQKMARVNDKNGVPQSTLDHINKKRLVFVVDECHRGVYGAMLMDIKRAFPRALLFGFTGTPVFEENANKEITTDVIFGDMLHKYSLASGIPDKNVLGFDIYREDTFNEEDIRNAYALRKAGAESIEELENDPLKTGLYDEAYAEPNILKIEDEVKSLYESKAHRETVMYKIMEDFPTLSRNGLFHAMLTVKNIPEAIAYYQLFKEHYPDFNVAAVFDDSIDNVEKAVYKEEAILEMLDDYNRKFGTNFQQSTYAKYKKDVSNRLAHKGPHKRVYKKKQINLLIVVTQMLTGYDSKFVNVLYADKLMKYIDIIQAFSRTNRLYGPEKPFGIIKYFTRPNRMAKNIEEALELYIDQPMSVFIDKLEANLEKINKALRTITAIFKSEGILDFNRLPDSVISRKKFAKEFSAMSRTLEAARMQGFFWDKKTYEFKHTNGYVSLTVELDEEIYKILLARYRELFERDGGEGGEKDVYELEPYLTETGAGTIDADYINSKFLRYVKYLYTEGADSEMVKRILEDLHHVFATLSQRDQRTALNIIHDIQRGDLRLSPDKTIYDYINDYQKRQADHQIQTLCEITGLNPTRLSDIINDEVNEGNYNDSGRFDDLMKDLKAELLEDFLKRVTGRDVAAYARKAQASRIVRRFILDPADRSKILYAYHHDDAALDQDLPADTDVDGAGSDDDSANAPDVTVLSDQQKRDNVFSLVCADLRGLRGWPGTDKTVDAFFKIVNLPTSSEHNGLAFEFYKVFDELFARNPVKYVDKQVHLCMLLIRFEVYLKKLYFILNGEEIPAPSADRHATLADAVKAFGCLWGLRQLPGERYRRLEGYLANLRSWRNSTDGNGAHASIFMSEDELDRRIKEVVTLYMYVTGASLDDIVEARPELA